MTKILDIMRVLDVIFGGKLCYICFLFFVFFYIVIALVESLNYFLLLFGRLNFQFKM